MKTKKIECLVLVLLVFCIGHLLAEPCGDVNSDGAIDIVDALLIAQHYVGSNPENFDEPAGDVNNDGVADILDALLIAQFYVGLIPALPGCDEIPTPTPEPTLVPTVDPECPYVGPPGYYCCADEGESVTFDIVVNVAYGADGSFNYLYEVTGTITFDNDTFGDPIYGTVKHGFYQETGSPTPTPVPTLTPTPTPTPCVGDNCVEITGELRQWHQVILTFWGPNVNETDDPSPFLNYRLDVTFRNGGREIVVPGYFAADGDAAETSASSGDRWRVQFVPDTVGEWSFSTSFRQGTNVSIDSNPLAGQPVDPDGITGSFTVLPTDKTGRDHRYQGMLEYADNHYYRYAGTGDYFIQVGTQSPENFIGYGEFDNMYDLGGGGGDMRDGLHWYDNHKQDWRQGDPTWKDGKGKGIIGALNYLAGLGMNAYYIITMNITGDCRETWPFISHNSSDYFTYDVSKLDQWDIVFSHGNTLGMLVLVNVEEEESERLLGKMTDPKRKLYYRELIARFAHNQAIQWNLSEEADKHGWNDAQDLKDHCNYIRNLDPYDHPIGWVQYKGEYMDDDETYGMMYGFPNFEACGLQNDPGNTGSRTKRWVDNSADHGRKWIVPILEANLGNNGVPPDSNDYWHDNIREQCIWPNLMAGGAGCGFYYGENFPNSDNDCEDFRPREHLFELEDIARQFFIKHVPFWDGMHHDDNLVSGSYNYVYAKPDEVYAIYLRDGGSPTLNLSGASGNFTVRWYDPRNGGDLQTSNVTMVTGGSSRSLGNPPNETSKDWAVLVQR